MVDRSMMHLKPEELMEYFDGTLDNRRVRNHLSSCFQCRSRLKDLSLTRTMMSPPEAEAPGEHVPSEIMAQYVEDTLSIQQNRAVEDHLARCRLCLGNLVSLRTATGMPLNKMPPEAVAAGVKKHLEGYRLITPLGALLLGKYEDEVTILYKPVPGPDDPEIYTDPEAKKRFPFKRGSDLRSRVEDMTRKTRLRSSKEIVETMELDVSYHQSDRMAAAMPAKPSGETVSTDTAQLSFALDERDEKMVLTVRILDLDGAEPLAGVKITVTPVRGKPATLETSDAGMAELAVPDIPSTLRIHLEKIYELDLQTLI